MSLLPFLLAALVLAFTPGPGIAYVVARTVAGGRAEGLASCLGTALGGGVHVVAAAWGLSLLIAQSALAFTVLKYVGAAYLVYLGLRILLRKRPSATDLPAVRASGVRRALLEGAVVEALNVKTALFFLAFLPQFISPTEPPLGQVILLGGLCVALNTLADVLAVVLAHRLLASGTGRQARERLMQRVSGVTMIGLGVFLALARRQT